MSYPSSDTHNSSVQSIDSHFSEKEARKHKRALGKFGEHYLSLAHLWTILEYQPLYSLMVSYHHEMEPNNQGPKKVRDKWIESQYDLIGGNSKEKIGMLDSVSTATNEK